jgi:hypothetical protein
MKRSFLAVLAGTALALSTVVPLAYGQGFIIKEEVVGPNVKYMSGGVGLEERNALESLALKGYDLKLVFAITPGNYLSYIDVKIQDQTGNPVITAQSNGPWFYADLPKGTYTVVVSHDGVQKTQKVTVDGEMQRVAFHWKPDQTFQAYKEGQTKAGAAERKAKTPGQEKKQPVQQKKETGQTEKLK